MPEPYNYSLNLQPVNLAADFTRGVQLGEIELERKQKEQAMALATEKARQEQIRQAKLAEYASNPTLKNIRAMAIMDPGNASKFQDLIKGLSEEQQSNVKGQVWSAFAAQDAGRKDLAVEIYGNIEKAARESGMQGYADTAKLLKQMLESPETGELGDKQVKLTAGMFLASVDPDTYTKYMNENRTQQKAPFELKRSEADAKKAQTEADVAAKYLDQETAAKLKETGVRTQAILDDTELKRAKNRIDAMQAATARMAAGSQQQKILLDIEKEKRTLNEAMRTKIAEGQDALGTAQTTLDLLSWMRDPKQTSARKGATGGYRFTIPGTEERDYETKIEQLTNMLALPNLGQLKGAMSDKDIIFIKSVSTNLDRSQSEKSFKRELDRLANFMESKRKQVIQKYGLPETSGPVTGAASVDELMRMLGK